MVHAVFIPRCSHTDWEKGVVQFRPQTLKRNTKYVWISEPRQSERQTEKSKISYYARNPKLNPEVQLRAPDNLLFLVIKAHVVLSWPLNRKALGRT